MLTKEIENTDVLQEETVSNLVQTKEIGCQINPSLKIKHIRSIGNFVNTLVKTLELFLMTFSWFTLF